MEKDRLNPEAKRTKDARDADKLSHEVKRLKDAMAARSNTARGDSHSINLRSYGRGGK